MEDFSSVQVTDGHQAGMAAPFAPHQIIYSRSDERGVILFGNATFQEISEYSWAELRGAPHKIIRHPDMPRGIFWIMWDRLTRGLPVVAYVKNRTRSGRYYWALAYVSPCPGGYLSIRIRPDDDLRATMEAEYSALLAREETQNLKPERSAEAFLARLKELGHIDYEAFMRTALTQELKARTSRLGRTDRIRANALDGILELSQQADDYVQRMAAGFRNIRAEPINMRILSNRMEDGGAAISSISQNYEVMAADMGQDLASLDTGDGETFGQIRSAVTEGHFALHAAEIAMEAALEMTTHREALAGHGVDIDAELALIHQFAALTQHRSVDSLKLIAGHAERLSETCRRLRRRINGLDVVKLMCRVESGRLENPDAALTGIIDRLAKFHLEIDRNLVKLGRCAGGMTRNVKSCR
ncbi:PAS domain-containing protein [Chachezhania sediminis]|uniref:PAS domain-containing protein n=1 Tax=Chachezhania sediminis TaxID=2599291 RepID=UPI00131B2C0F|nr:PAS domain-containing protein [Chachezhania sediminis]